jgi:hypothetical protein
MTDQRGGSQASSGLSASEQNLNKLQELRQSCSGSQALFPEVKGKQYLLLWSGVDGSGQPNRDHALLKLAQQADVNARLPTTPTGSPWDPQPPQRTNDVQRLEELASKAANQPGCPFTMIDFTAKGKEMAELDQEARASGVDPKEIERSWTALSEKFVGEFAGNEVPNSSKAVITFSEGASPRAVVQKEFGSQVAHGVQGISTGIHDNKMISDQPSGYQPPTGGQQIH